MSGVKKSLGVSAISGQPDKPLRFRYKDKSIKTEHIADGAVTSEKLGSDIGEIIRPLVVPIVKEEFEKSPILEVVRQVFMEKQDVIEDLDSIRDGASKGATALQEHQSLENYYTKSEVEGMTAVESVDSAAAMWSN